MEEGRSFCVLCSSSSRETTRDNGSLNTIYKLIKKHRSVLSSRCESGLEGDEVGGPDGYGSLEVTLKELEEERYSMCGHCNKLAVGALETRSRADELEIEVRALQRQLLELLRKLKEEMEVFNQEMKKIEVVVMGNKQGGESSGPLNLSGDTEEGSSSEENRRACQKAEFVREQILEVVTDLRFFQSELNDKLIVSRMEEQEEDDEESESFEMPMAEVNFVPETEDEVEVVTCDASLLEGDPQIADGEDEISQEYSRYVGHYILGGGDQHGYQEDTMDNCSRSSDDATSSTYFRTSTPRKKSNNLKSEVKSEMFKSINLSMATTFKRDLIKRAIEREVKRKEEDNFHENPLIKYYLRYDPPTDSFYVGNVQIRLLDYDEDRVSPRENKLECTGPGCNVRWSPPANNEHTTTFDRDIRNHVIGKHLGGFSCRVCNLILDSYFKLMSHFKKQHPGQKPLNDNSTDGGYKANQQFHNFFSNVSSPSTSESLHRNGLSNGVDHKITDNHSPSRFKSLDKFRKKVPKVLRSGVAHHFLAPEGQELQVPLSPSEGLKQVRMTMKNAIESLGEVPHPTPNHQNGLLQEGEPPQKKATRNYSKPKVKARQRKSKRSLRVGNQY